MIVPLKMIVSCTMPPPVTRPAAKVKIVPGSQVVKCPAPRGNCERHTAAQLNVRPYCVKQSRAEFRRRYEAGSTGETLQDSA
jgi:hypothetical protein